MQRLRDRLVAGDRRPEQLRLLRPDRDHVQQDVQPTEHLRRQRHALVRPRLLQLGAVRADGLRLPGTQIAQFLATASSVFIFYRQNGVFVQQNEMTITTGDEGLLRLELLMSDETSTYHTRSIAKSWMILVINAFACSSYGFSSSTS